jgi:hypothetical protein
LQSQSDRFAAGRAGKPVKTCYLPMFAGRQNLGKLKYLSKSGGESWNKERESGT